MDDRHRSRRSHLKRKERLSKKAAAQIISPEVKNTLLLWLKRLHTWRPKNASLKFRARARLVVFPMVLLYDELLLRFFAGEGLFGHPIYLFFSVLGCGICFAGLTFPFKAKINRRIANVLMALMMVLFATECIIKSVFVTYMSPSNLLAGAENAASNYTMQVVRSVLFGIPKILLFVLPFYLFLHCGKAWVSMKKFPKSRAAFMIGLSLVITGIYALGASHGSNAAVYGAQFDYNRCTKTFGLLTSTRLSIKYSIFGNHNSTFKTESVEKTAAETEAEAEAADSEDLLTSGLPVIGPVSEAETILQPVSYGKNEMDLNLETAAANGNSSVRSLVDYIESLDSSDKNAYTGLFEGKNLIMVCAESYCNAFISEELTPTLWRLSHNGFCFDEYYQPEWGGSTTTGEVAYLVGLAPSDGDESMTNLIDNTNYFTMANQLKRLGYLTTAYHNGEYTYYSRNETHPSLGFDEFIADETGMKDLTGYNYAHDGDMIDATMELYLDQEPFCIYYMTISGHAPYEEENELVAEYYDRVNAVVGDQYEETTKYYICYQLELETAMSNLVAKLEESGKADDTVIVLTGDHFPYGLGVGEAWGNDEDYVIDLMKTDDDYSWNEDRNGLIIWSGCLENEEKAMWKEIDSPTFSLDILPTLSNLFGLEYDSRMFPGRDVFSDEEAIVFWNNLCWVTKEGKYDSDEQVFYPRNESGDYDNYISRINNIVENKLLMSREIMENDFYELLF